MKVLNISNNPNIFHITFNISNSVHYYRKISEVLVILPTFQSKISLIIEFTYFTMKKHEIQRYIITKLIYFKPPKWGASHTEEKNIVKGLPPHLRGTKLVNNAIAELYQNEFLLKLKKTGEWHVSLNPSKKKEIFEFLGLI